MLAPIENAFIDRVLTHVLDGNKGSNILGFLLLALLSTHIDWVKAFRGFQFQDQDAAMESAKLVGTILVSVFAWFVGKRKGQDGPTSQPTKPNEG